MSNKNKQSKKSPLFIILLGAGLLVLAGLLYWGLSSSKTTVTNTPVQSVPLTDAEVERVSLSDAKAAFDSESALFVDTRDLDSYTQGHIPGAVLITSSQVESKLRELDPSVPVITYCT